MISRYHNLSQLLGKSHSAFLFGPRGVGKSHLAGEFLDLVKRRGGSATFQIDLLSLKQQSRYAQHPELFRTDIELQLQLAGETKRLLVFIDEIQKLPVLLDEVHYFLESKYKSRIRFLLTGSSARKLKRGGANLLAGRAISLALHPLSLLEIPLNLERALRFGTLPRYYLEDDQTALLLESYVDTYLREEIQSERLVRALAPFQLFLSIAAQMNGEPINYSKIGREASISDQAVRDYYSILVDTHLAFELPAWTRSARDQTTKAPKFYIFDCGVLNALCGELQVEVSPSTRRYGDLFETFVITEFFRQRDYLQLRNNFAFWRTNRGKEVDLVIDRGLRRPPVGIEIKSADYVQSDSLKSLQLFGAEFPEAPLFCICRTAQPYTIEGVRILPWESGVTNVLRSECSAA